MPAQATELSEALVAIVTLVADTIVDGLLVKAQRALSGEGLVALVARYTD